MKLRPKVVYTVFLCNDVHSDRALVSDALMAATKTFRYPSVKQILAFETLSETEFSLRVDGQCFRPNFFVNIEEFIEKKISIMSHFESEISEFPFPRSEFIALETLARYRGIQAGCNFC